MDGQDLASFKFIKGFLYRSLKLDDKLDEIVKDPTMDITKYELQFYGTSQYIFRPLQTIITMQKFQRKFDPTMKDELRLWRVLRPISHIFIEEIEKLFETERISMEMRNYIEMKGWPIS